MFQFQENYWTVYQKKYKYKYSKRVMRRNSLTIFRFIIAKANRKKLKLIDWTDRDNSWEKWIIFLCVFFSLKNWKFKIQVGKLFRWSKRCCTMQSGGLYWSNSNRCYTNRLERVYSVYQHLDMRAPISEQI